MTRARKIDKEGLRRMWMAGVPSKDIAATYGVNYPAVNSMAEKMGLPKRGNRGRQGIVVPPTAEPSPEPPAQKHEGIDAALSSARGYADLRDISARYGITLSEAQRRWHRCRA